MLCLYCLPAALQHVLPSHANTDMSLAARIACLCGDVQRKLAECFPDRTRQHLTDVNDRPAETAEMMDLIIDRDITQGMLLLIL